MDLQKIIDIAWQHMGSRKAHPAREPGWLYYHGLRTAEIARELDEACGTGVAGDILTVGALFHDIGKGEKAHAEAGADLTRELLSEECGSSDLEEICDLVRYHNQRQDTSGMPDSVKLVQDADCLDHVGPMGSWLAFYWSGTHDESALDSLAFIHGEENRTYQAGMRDSLNFDISVAYFDERLEWEKQFFGTFERVYQHGVWHP